MGSSAPTANYLKQQKGMIVKIIPFFIFQFGCYRLIVGFVFRLAVNYLPADVQPGRGICYYVWLVNFGSENLALKFANFRKAIIPIHS